MAFSPFLNGLFFVVKLQSYFIAKVLSIYFCFEKELLLYS